MIVGRAQRSARRKIKQRPRITANKPGDIRAFTRSHCPLFDLEKKKEKKQQNPNNGEAFSDDSLLCCCRCDKKAGSQLKNLGRLPGRRIFKVRNTAGGTTHTEAAERLAGPSLAQAPTKQSVGHMVAGKPRRD